MILSSDMRVLSWRDIHTHADVTISPDTVTLKQPMYAVVCALRGGMKRGDPAGLTAVIREASNRCDAPNMFTMPRMVLSNTASFYLDRGLLLIRGFTRTHLN